MNKFSHTDEYGQVRMVDVSNKRFQRRVARAAGRIMLAESTVALIRGNGLQKGDVIAAARIAGIQAAKRTAELIPLCHTLPLAHINVEATLESDGVVVRSDVSCIGPTGVEMEALTAVAVALLTVYDMCKAVDNAMKIGDIVLLEKTKVDLDAGIQT